ncbi:YycH family regulatory protein [Alkalibacillus haloalkaliphilus]|uniref:Transcriptional regulator n=1 Tax=Alkalibacillus haloalkaliphilus TaxID=94136 RepID=A0A511W3M2_9BACI|nr:two-component system activity regulator YycH [Alkalibacillus haloalkaliphilus]GEN44643.1 transcriptional regulator [Alkalibacillus haloalkaliphilus]
MNKEQFKTALLVLLVISSLLLTLALWTYQPEYEELDQATYLEETELDGEPKHLSQVLQPDLIVFNETQQSTTESAIIPDKQEEVELFEEIADWSFSQIDSHISSGSWGLWSPNMELVFPVDVPISLIDQLFNVEQFEFQHDHTFNRVYFQLIQSSEERIEVTFMSDNEEEVLNGEIESVSAYETIQNFFYRADMASVEKVDIGSDEERKIYLTTDEMEVPQQTVFTEDLNEQPLVNVLFSNPSLVRQQNVENENEVNYTDGTRLLTLIDAFNSSQYLSYYKPPVSGEDHSGRQDILLRSLDFTNDHYGWTDDFRLEDVNYMNQVVDYRIHQNGIPVFDDNGYMVMEQAWGPQELQSLSRPLFRVTNRFDLGEGDQVTLQSGKSVYSFLENASDEFYLPAIEDIKIGYEVVRDTDSANNLIFLEPTWFIEYANGVWRPLSYFEDRASLQEDG